MGRREKYIDITLRHFRGYVFVTFFILVSLKTPSIFSTYLVNQTLVLVVENLDYNNETQSSQLEDWQGNGQWYCDERESFLDWKVENKKYLGLFLAQLRLAYKFDSFNSRALRYAGELAWLSEDHDQALDEMEKAVGLDENDQFAIYLLAEYYSEVGLPEEVISIFEITGESCRSELLQGSYISLIKEAVDQGNHLAAKYLLLEALQKPGPKLCLQTYAVDHFEYRDNNKLADYYTMADFLPSNPELMICLLKRISLLVDLGTWTTEDLIDLALLWRWQGLQTEVQILLDDQRFYFPSDPNCNGISISSSNADQYTLDDSIRQILNASSDFPITVGENLLQNGSFENASEWEWFIWNNDAWFPENFYVGGLAFQNEFDSNYVLRIQGLKKGLMIDENKNRPNTFAGYITSPSSPEIDQFSTYIISLSYRTCNLRSRQPHIAIFDEHFKRIEFFQLKPTSGEWWKAVFIWRPNEPVQARLGLVMPARGVVEFDNIEFRELKLPHNQDTGLQLPYRWFSGDYYQNE